MFNLRVYIVLSFDCFLIVALLLDEWKRKFKPQ